MRAMWVMYVKIKFKWTNGSLESLFSSIWLIICFSELTSRFSSLCSIILLILLHSTVLTVGNVVVSKGTKVVYGWDEGAKILISFTTCALTHSHGPTVPFYGSACICFFCCSCPHMFPCPNLFLKLRNNTVLCFPYQCCCTFPFLFLGSCTVHTLFFGCRCPRPCTFPYPFFNSCPVHTLFCSSTRERKQDRISAKTYSHFLQTYQKARDSTQG